MDQYPACALEQGPIRPPNEAGSLLIRLTRNCPWNRCLFCPVYKEQTFSRRGVEEIKRDIDTAAYLYREALGQAGGSVRQVTGDFLERFAAGRPAALQIAQWLYRGAENVFLQDADCMVMPAEALREVLQHLREKLPQVRRVTAYARSRSLARKSVAELQGLRESGLDRVHVGLESGYDPLLEFMRKGATAALHIEAGLKAREAGLSLSEYVILGLGGKRWWREHARATAAVLNAIDPDFIRVRTLAVHPSTPLYGLMARGAFEPLDEDTTILEEREFIAALKGIGSAFASDHILNLLEEVAGTLPGEGPKMLAVLDRYLALAPEERERFRLGRRAGLYRSLDDSSNPVLAGQVDRLYRGITAQGMSVDQFIAGAMRRYL